MGSESRVSFTTFLPYPFSLSSLSPRFLAQRGLHFRVSDARVDAALHFYRRDRTETGAGGKGNYKKESPDMAICHVSDRSEDVKLQSAVTARSFAREQQVIHHNQQRTKRTGKWMDDLRARRPSFSERTKASFRTNGFQQTRRLTLTV